MLYLQIYMTGVLMAHSYTVLQHRFTMSTKLLNAMYISINRQFKRETGKIMTYKRFGLMKLGIL
ncbi:MAG: hypothetical protein DBX53_03060 [Clostridiales bacterium]|nr:MAG: hypothetical protein DBX53_03060 [Clostridiales bacterium]